jgi:hypothetical protein
MLYSRPHYVPVLLVLAGMFSPLYRLASAQSVPATQAVASAVDGVWLGPLQPAPGKQLRIQLHLKMGPPEACALDSLDQGAEGIPCEHLQLKGQA